MTCPNFRLLRSYPIVFLLDVLHNKLTTKLLSLLFLLGKLCVGLKKS